MKSLEILRPDDWHVHFRDHAQLIHTVNATAKHFARALVMPNLLPPLTSVEALLAYRNRILNACSTTTAFTPYMTLYINDHMPPDTLIEAKQHDFILGAKLYPAHATTHSASGVHDIKALYPLFSLMQSQNQVLQIHGEVTHSDIFDREKYFIEEQLQPLIQAFPKLRIVLEHISTRAAVTFIEEGSPYLAGTITPHHLLYDRNDLLAGGIKPHFYCLPILKRREDRIALQRAATRGNPKFFAGTDSAPHAVDQKESSCGCAGIYSAPFALSLYASCFDELEKIDKLELFVSRFGAEFYQLPLNKEHCILEKRTQLVPKQLPFGSHQVVPIAAGQPIVWSVHDKNA